MTKYQKFQKNNKIKIQQINNNNIVYKLKISKNNTIANQTDNLYMKQNPITSSDFSIATHFVFT
ncbi:hypothetical protein BHC43_08965 [Snodgrassella alvi]|nr:hypothetical protein BHC43_08965 [Snodgrassella alvi]